MRELQSWRQITAVRKHHFCVIRKKGSSELWGNCWLNPCKNTDERDRKRKSFPNCIPGALGGWTDGHRLIEKFQTDFFSLFFFPLRHVDVCAGICVSSGWLSSSSFFSVGVCWTKKCENTQFIENHGLWACRIKRYHLLLFLFLFVGSSPPLGVADELRDWNGQRCILHGIAHRRQLLAGKQASILLSYRFCSDIPMNFVRLTWYHHVTRLLWFLNLLSFDQWIR